MKLIEYLDSEFISLPEFAKMIDYTHAHLWAYLRGKHGVSKRFAKAVEKATKGNVKIKDVLSHNTLKNRYEDKEKIKLAE